MTKCYFVYANYKCTKYQEGDHLTFKGFGEYRFAKPFFTKPNIAEIAKDFQVKEDELTAYEADLEDWLGYIQGYILETENKLVETEDKLTELVNKIQEAIDD